MCGQAISCCADRFAQRVSDKKHAHNPERFLHKLSKHAKNNKKSEMALTEQDFTDLASALEVCAGLDCLPSVDWLVAVGMGQLRNGNFLGFSWLGEDDNGVEVPCRRDNDKAARWSLHSAQSSYCLNVLTIGLEFMYRPMLLATYIQIVRSNLLRKELTRTKRSKKWRGI